MNPYQLRYALKANSNHHIIHFLHAQGCGVEVVSLGEYERALVAGVSPNKIVVSGVGKIEAELLNALDQKVDQISVESVAELSLLAKFNKPGHVCLRVNPNISGKTHHKITTATHHNKFGIFSEELPQCFDILKKNPQLQFLGFSVHLGSQIWDVSPYEEAFCFLKNLVIDWNQKGFQSSRLDLGGGFAVDYTNGGKTFPLQSYAEMVHSILDPLGCEYIIEPGRFLVAEAGSLVTKILYIKKTPYKTFVIVDAAMNDMMRPALYDAVHPIYCLNNQEGPSMVVDVVGPVCESSDCFAQDIQLPASLKAGDFLIIGVTGAYGASLANTYNSRPLIGEYFWQDGVVSCIRPPVGPTVFLNFEKKTILL